MDTCVGLTGGAAPGGRTWFWFWFVVWFVVWMGGGDVAGSGGPNCCMAEYGIRGRVRVYGGPRGAVVLVLVGEVVVAVAVAVEYVEFVRVVENRTSGDRGRVLE